MKLLINFLYKKNENLFIYPLILYKYQMCEEGTIYLIQPELVINTNKFKIGMSKKNDLSRFKSYHSGTRFICIMCCENPLIVEKKIKDAFRLKYKLVAGTEYFEGNEEEILIDFFKIISENKTKTGKKTENKIEIKKNNFIITN